MGAVRIYKAAEKGTGWRSDVYLWQVRSSGCCVTYPVDCNYGKNHDGHCNAFMSFDALLRHLNYRHSSLGEYISK